MYFTLEREKNKEAWTGTVSNSTKQADEEEESGTGWRVPKDYNAQISVHG